VANCAFADFGQMLVHGVDTDNRHDQGGAGAARRADGAEQVGSGEPPVAPDMRTRAALGPDAGPLFQGNIIEPK